MADNRYEHENEADLSPGRKNMPFVGQASQSENGLMLVVIKESGY